MEESGPAIELQSPKARSGQAERGVAITSLLIVPRWRESSLPLLVAFIFLNGILMTLN